MPEPPKEEEKEKGGFWNKLGKVLVVAAIPDASVSATSRHQGFHSVYNEVVSNQLNKMDVNLSADVLQKQVANMQANLRHLQEQGLPLYKGRGATADMWIKKLEKLK